MKRGTAELKPIIMSIQGGIGNQFFQYAAGYALAKKLGVPLKIYPKESYLPSKKWAIDDTRHFLLNRYNLSLSYADAKEVEQLLPKVPKKKRGLKKWLDFSTPAPLEQPRFFVEGPSTQYRPDFFEIEPPHLLEGCFLSYKYFHPLRKELIQLFQPTSPISYPGYQILQKIKASKTPIAIHFRRGDIINDPEIYKSIVGITTMTYYQNALKALLERLPAGSEPTLFLFSNDIAWVKDSFKTHLPTVFVDHSTAFMAHEDIYLMSQCRHHITAGGSTFSWMGAYLCPFHEDQIVIRTEKITNHANHNHPQDLFLPEWLSAPSS